MFLSETINRNKKLIDDVVRLHYEGKLAPDTYVIDVNTFVANAKKIRAATDKDLYFMLKQVGRNPYLAKKLLDTGFQGCVAVDFREALTMIKHNIHLSNVGHLVQIPRSLLSQIVQAKPDYITCFSLDKIREIDEVCGQLNYSRKNAVETCDNSNFDEKQKIMLKVIGDDDHLYPAQEGGFKLSELDNFPKFENVEIAGVTSFPCCIDGKLTPNYHTLLRAKEILGEQGFEIKNINAPSANCCSTIPMMPDADSFEPGHALTGTQPMPNQTEVPCVVYLSEVSHHYKDKSYIYGGGYYRRSNVKNALVEGEITEVNCPPVDSIDYHFMLDGHYKISSPVIMAFRFQMFVTRSSVALLEDGEIQGIYTPFGEKTYV